MSMIYPEWSCDVSYHSGNIVVYKGKFYILDYKEENKTQVSINESPQDFRKWKSVNIIKNTMSHLNQQLSNIYSQINSLRQSCPHEDLVGEYKANTGNWCREDDSYWLDLECMDCGKKWSVDSQSEDNAYRTTKFKKRDK